MSLQKLYDDFFNLKEVDEKVFEVEVIKSSGEKFWYADKVGQSFHVIEKDEKHLVVVALLDFNNRYREDGAYINKNDAVILT